MTQRTSQRQNVNVDRRLAIDHLLVGAQHCCAPACPGHIVIATPSNPIEVYDSR
jgi:hypothetical protein